MEKENTDKKSNVLDDHQESSSLSKKLELIVSSRDDSQTAENKSVESIMTSQNEMKSSCDESAPQGQVEDEVAVEFEGASMNDLPPEILTLILKNVYDSSLFECRLVNRLWLEISSEILCSRHEVEIEFRPDDDNKELSWWYQYVKRRGTLENFIKCMKEFKNGPFVRFYFHVSMSSLPKPLDFFSKFDITRIKCLKLSFSYKDFNRRDVRLTPFFEKLGDLLLGNKMPQLEEFGLEMHFEWNLYDPELNLFSSSSSSSSSSTSNTNANSNSVQLPHLKVVQFGNSMFPSCRKIFRELLTAAVNLKEINLPFFSYYLLLLNVSDVHFLESIGKLDCVKKVKIGPLSEFITHMDIELIGFPRLKLSELELCDPYDLHRSNNYWSDFAYFLSAVFESSKDTLTELIMPQYGFLDNLHFPTFTKLEILTLNQRCDFYSEAYEDHHPVFDFASDHDLYQLFPHGAKYGNVFPAVRLLNYNIHGSTYPYHEEESIPCLPAVERVVLNLHTDRIELDDKIKYLGLICPNIKDFSIDRFSDTWCNLEFDDFIKTISTHMPKLESLELFIDLDLEENNSHALDSSFTGFSEDNCKLLFDLAEADETLKTGESPAKILESQPNFSMPERERPSIFDMKDLKELTVNVWSGGEWVDLKEFIEKLTWISQEYALKLMPQLKLTQGESRW